MQRLLNNKGTKMKRFIWVFVCAILMLSFLGMRSYWNRLMTTQIHTVAIGADSLVTSATAKVTFPETFDSAPVVLVVPPWGIDGTWSVSGITTTICSVAVDACGDQASDSFKIVLVAHEKL